MFANGYGMPAATFAFPAVLVMVPGSYAFRAVIGLLAIVKAAGKSPVELQAETLSLVVTTVLLNDGYSSWIGHSAGNTRE